MQILFHSSTLFFKWYAFSWLYELHVHCDDHSMRVKAYHCMISEKGIGKEERDACGTRMEFQMRTSVRMTALHKHVFFIHAHQSYPRCKRSVLWRRQHCYTCILARTRRSIRTRHCHHSRRGFYACRVKSMRHPTLYLDLIGVYLLVVISIVLSSANTLHVPVHMVDLFLFLLLQHTRNTMKHVIVMYACHVTRPFPTPLFSSSTSMNTMMPSSK